MFLSKLKQNSQEIQRKVNSTKLSLITLLFKMTFSTEELLLYYFIQPLDLLKENVRDAGTCFLSALFAVSFLEPPCEETICLDEVMISEMLQGQI